MQVVELTQSTAHRLPPSAGLGAAWVVVSSEHALFELDAATGRRLARIALPLAPGDVAVAPKGAPAKVVWVGMLTAVPGTPDTLAKVDPRTRRIVGTFPVPDGIGSLVGTPTAVWVVHRLSASVSRFNLTSQSFDRPVSVGTSRLGDAAYGAGAVWVTSPLEDTVSRIDDKTGKKVAIGVGRRPTGIAAYDGQIWVTSFIDHTIWRINPATRRPVGDRVPVPLNPYALAVTGDSVWLTAVGQGEVARVRYTAAR